MSEMRAVVLRAPQDGPAVEVIDVDEPRAGEVRVRITASGICGSDLHVLEGTSQHAVMPVVMGHEGAGVVEAVGEGVTTHEVGDHVVVALFSGCGRCRYCVEQLEVLCDSPDRAPRLFGSRPDGSTTVHGGGDDFHPYTGVGALAEYTVVPHEQAIRIDPDVPLDILALAGCGVMTGLGAVFNAAAVRPGSSVAVIGCGGVGLSVIQGARIAGARQIIALDLNEGRLGVAREVGATQTVDTSSAPLVDGIKDLVKDGADYVFEVVGHPALVTQALEATRPGGATIIVGTPQGPRIDLDARTMFYNRRLMGTLAGSSLPARDIPRIVDLYKSGALRLDEMITNRFPISRGEEALRLAADGAGARVLVTMAE
jgi:S-(hydroxymethyl)glutathione dehydrogenase/alcohol dehydrogenase